MLIGYARVSTVDQDTALQLDALNRAGCHRLFQEQRSGAGGTHRPELDAMLASVTPGDVVTVYKIDRLARSLSQLLQILAQLEARGAQFRSLTEPIDTTSLTGRMLMQMLGAFAEFERGMIRERCMAGRRAAVERGKIMGRPPMLTPAQDRDVLTQYLAGVSQPRLAKSYGCHRNVIGRAVMRARLAAVSTAP